MHTRRQIVDPLTILIDWFPYLLTGIFITVGLVAVALIIGVVLGLPMALGQVYGKLPLRSAISVYVWFFRGLPVLVLLFLFYFWYLSRSGTRPSCLCCWCSCIRVERSCISVTDLQGGDPVNCRRTDDRCTVSWNEQNSGDQINNSPSGHANSVTGMV